MTIEKDNNDYYYDDTLLSRTLSLFPSKKFFRKVVVDKARTLKMKMEKVEEIPPNPRHETATTTSTMTTFLGLICLPNHW